jgi:hypothetical protein
MGGLGGHARRVCLPPYCLTPVRAVWFSQSEQANILQRSKAMSNGSPVTGCSAQKKERREGAAVHLLAGLRL